MRIAMLTRACEYETNNKILKKTPMEIDENPQANDGTTSHSAERLNLATSRKYKWRNPGNCGRPRQARHATWHLLHMRGRL